MSYTGERFLPTESNHEMNIEHYQRYRFALQLVKGKTILDAACGEGYGSYLLSQEATHVFGMDIDAVVVSEASKKYTASNLQYLVGNVSSLPFENGSFDCVVSFETLEHIDSDSQIKFLSEIKRILKPDGILIMSSPNKAVYTDLVQGKNKFHIKELYCNEFIELLKNYFQYFINYSQYPDTGYFICSPNETLTIEYNGKAIEKSRYIISVCSNRPLTYHIDTQILSCFDDSMYYFLNLYSHQLEEQLLNLKEESNRFQKQQEDSIQNQKLYINQLTEENDNAKKYLFHLEKDIKELKEYIGHLERDNEELKNYIVQMECASNS